MDVERGVNPNCSELMVRINSLDTFNVKETLRAADIEEVLVKNFYKQYKEIGDWDEDPVCQSVIKTSDLNPKIKELLQVLRSSTNTLDYDSIYKQLEELGFNDLTDSILLSDGKLQPDFEHRSTVSIGIADDEYHYGVMVIGHQHCQVQIFPILKKISDIFNAEVVAHDGASSEMYEAWVNDGCPNINDWRYEDE